MVSYRARSVYLTTLFLGSLSLKRLTSILHILSPETDNCPTWISRRERMTVENISWLISTKKCCQPRRGLNPRPPGLQSDGASNWATEAGYRLSEATFYDSINAIYHILSPCRNWQLPFLNQRKGENDHRKYFMISLHERMLLTQRRSNPQPPDHLSDEHPTEPLRLANNGWLKLVFDSLEKYSDSSRKQIFRDILGKFSYFIMKMSVLIKITSEGSLMSALNIPLFYRRSKRHP